MKSALRNFADSLKNTYAVGHILRNEDEEHQKELRRRMWKRNYGMFVPTACVVILVAVFFVVSDVLNGFYQDNYPYSMLNLAAEITHLSVLLVLLVLFFDRREKTDRICRGYVRVYLFLCALGCSLYMLSDTLRGVVSSTPYLSVILLVAVPVLFEREFWFYYGIYLLPTVCCYVRTGHIDTMNLLLNLVGYLLHLFTLAGFVRENLIKIKYENSLAELTKMSRTDFLTKIGNRQMLYETLQKNRKRWISEGKEVCLIMFDIDHFKCYNDTYSHLQGDQCLVRVSTAIREVLSEKSNLESTFIRFGGEEFLIMLVGNQLEPELYEIHESIRKSLELLAIPSGKGAFYPYVTVSAGAEISAFTEDFVLEDALRLADAQLYHVKKSGRNDLSFRGQLLRENKGYAGEGHA